MSNNVYAESQFRTEIYELEDGNISAYLYKDDQEIARTIRKTASAYTSETKPYCAYQTYVTKPRDDGTIRYQVVSYHQSLHEVLHFYGDIMASLTGVF